MIKIREKDALFLGMNFVTFLFSLDYLILHDLSEIAMELSAKALPLWETGIYTHMAYAEIIFVSGIMIVLIYDMWWIARELARYIKERRRDTL